MSSPLRFATFELDPATGVLRKAGLLVRLQPQPFKVLTILASRPNEVVSRDELKRLLWGEKTFVDFERGLNYCIAQIRGVLGDSADAPRFIETLPKLGYRFIAPVDRLKSAHPPAPGRTARPIPRRPGRLAARVGIGLGAAVLLAAIAWSVPWRRDRDVRTPTSAIKLAVLPFFNLTGETGHDTFAAGLTEEVVTDLARLDPARLGVIGNAPVLRLGGAEKDIPRIREELGAEFVVLGRLRRQDSAVRITVHLIRTSDFTHLWTGTSDHDAGDALGVQRAVAGEVSKAIAAELLPDR